MITSIRSLSPVGSLVMHIPHCAFSTWLCLFAVRFNVGRSCTECRLGWCYAFLMNHIMGQLFHFASLVHDPAVQTQRCQVCVSPCFEYSCAVWVFSSQKMFLFHSWVGFKSFGFIFPVGHAFFHVTHIHMHTDTTALSTLGR